MRKRLTGLLERSTKFLIDTNLFVAAVKSGRTKSTELLLRLVEGTWDLVADDMLIRITSRCRSCSNLFAHRSNPDIQ